MTPFHPLALSLQSALSWKVISWLASTARARAASQDALRDASPRPRQNGP